jgi:HlyD family secretion protein
MDAQGRVKQAEGQVAEARSRIAQSEAQLAQAEVNLRQARYDAGKYERLSESGDVPEQRATQARSTAEALEKVVDAQKNQIESARAALTAALGTLNVAKANLANPSIRTSQAAAVQKQIDQAEGDIEAANADAEAARAKLREAEANKSDLTVVAPFDGIVATRSAEPGEVVSAGTTIVTIIDPSAIYLRAFVPEGQIGKVKVGQKARVYLDSAPSTPIEAEVTRIDPEATFTPENTYFQDERVKQVVGVKLMIKAPKGSAKPGMPADGEILISGE